MAVTSSSAHSSEWVPAPRRRDDQQSRFGELERVQERLGQEPLPGQEDVGGGVSRARDQGAGGSVGEEHIHRRVLPGDAT